MNKAYADLPGYFCKIQGKIIQFQPYISKPDCYDVYQIFIEHPKTGYIYQVYGTRNLHDTCFQESFDGGWFVPNILQLPNLYTLDKMLGKSLYFTIAQDTFAEIRDIRSQIPNLIFDISENKPDTFSQYPWCPVFLEKNSSPQEITHLEPAISYNFIIIGILGGVILGFILTGFVHKFFFFKK